MKRMKTRNHLLYIQQFSWNFIVLVCIFFFFLHINMYYQNYLCMKYMFSIFKPKS